MQIRLIPVLLALLGAGACQGLTTGSEAYLAPEFESSDASFQEWGVVLQCTVDAPRADRCGFLAGPAGKKKKDYPATLQGNRFSVVLSDTEPGITYEWQAYIEAGWKFRRKVTRRS